MMLIWNVCCNFQAAMDTGIAGHSPHAIPSRSWGGLNVAYEMQQDPNKPGQVLLTISCSEYATTHSYKISFSNFLCYVKNFVHMLCTYFTFILYPSYRFYDIGLKANTIYFQRLFKIWNQGFLLIFVCYIIIFFSLISHITNYCNTVNTLH